MAKETDKILIRKFIAGNCNPAEQVRMKVLMQQPGSEELFDEVLNEDWSGFKKEKQSPDSYIQNFQHRLKERLDATARPLVIAKNEAIPTKHYFYRYAAACLLLLSTCFWYYNSFYKSKYALNQEVVMMENSNPAGQRSIITLPDNSVVHLGAASSIRYPKKFGSLNREVILKGEAYFSVTHDKKHPFTVQTGAVQTRVLGTSFKIDAFSQVVVSVITGRVQVSKISPNSKLHVKPLAILTPGQQVSWDSKTDKSTLADIDPEEVKDWTVGKVTLVNTPLSEIASILERWYNLDIQLADKDMDQIRLSLIVKNTVPIQHSLDIICSTAHLKYKLSGRKISISKVH